MKQRAIPYLFMRGGTSRGPYFKRGDLPEDLDTLAEVLIAIIGAGHPLNIDGIGGGKSVTTKVAMLSHSEDEWADIDYFFAQVSVEERQVDFKPSCGNILSGVGPAAIEMGLFEPTGAETEMRIRAVNTGARIIARVQTPDGVSYTGDTRIDGVPGSGSAISLQFADTVGGVTGAFLPSGQVLDTFDGIDVTCMDVAMPVVMARAESFGLTGRESAAELDANANFMQRMEAIRRQAGLAMGMGDVSESVTPKFALLAPAVQGGSASTRYFMPKNCHPSMAVTGAQCLASCLLAPGSVAAGLVSTGGENPATIVLEHPSGKMDVIVEYAHDSDGFRPLTAGLIRTARKLADGCVYVPADVWPI